MWQTARCSRLLMLGLPILLISAACQRKPAPTSVTSGAVTESDSVVCQTIQHEQGETEICGQPQKIVAFGSSVLESLLALGLQPVAYADYLIQPTALYYEQPIWQFPYMGHHITSPVVNLGLATSPSIERIAKVQPDLILGTEYNTDQYATLSQVAPTLLLKWAEADKNLQKVAQITNKSEKVEQLFTETDKQIETTRKMFAPVVAAQPNVLLLHSGNLQEIYFGNQVFGLCASLVRDLGFELVSLPGFNEFNSNTPAVISIEALPQLNDADLVLMFGSNFNQAKELTGTDNFEEYQLSSLKQAWQENEIAQSLDASLAGQVYFIPYYLCAGLPGPIGTELYLNELKQKLLSAQ